MGGRVLEFCSVFTSGDSSLSAASVMAGCENKRRGRQGRGRTGCMGHSEMETDKRLRKSGKTPSSGTEAGKVWETENSTISEM